MLFSFNYSAEAVAFGTRLSIIPAVPSGLDFFGFIPRVALATLTYPGLFSFVPFGDFKE
jgi:hypothetical protein